MRRTCMSGKVRHRCLSNRILGPRRIQKCIHSRPSSKDAQTCEIAVIVTKSKLAEPKALRRRGGLASLCPVKINRPAQHAAGQARDLLKFLPLQDYHRLGRAPPGAAYRD